MLDPAPDTPYLPGRVKTSWRADAADWHRLTLDRVCLSFNRNKASQYQALNGMTMSVQKGEFYCLLGPSGCGKSTVLHLVAGFTNPESGCIRMGSREIAGVPSTDRVMVFQDAASALFPWLRAHQNVEFGLRLQGLSRAEAAKRARHFLDLVGLAEHVHKFPYELSGGMKQRCQLARALVVEPEVLLMDEPFAALDAISKRILQKELLRIWQKLRMTVVYITHDVNEALLLAERVAVMRRGPGSNIKREFKIEQPHPRNPNDPALVSVFANVERSLEEEVGNSLYAG